VVETELQSYTTVSVVFIVSKQTSSYVDCRVVPYSRRYATSIRFR